METTVIPGKKADNKTQQVANLETISGWGTAEIIAGKPGISAPTIEGEIATETSLITPTGIAIDSQKNIFISDADAHMIWKIANDTRRIMRFAGNGSWGETDTSSIPTNTALKSPWGLFVSESHGLSLTDRFGGSIFQINNEGSSIVNVLNKSIHDESGNSILEPNSIVNGPNGLSYIVDTRMNALMSFNSTTQALTQIVGHPDGLPGFTREGRIDEPSSLRAPSDLAIESDGNILIADSENHVVRRVNFITNQIEIIAGTGNPGFSGDQGPATLASLDSPQGLAIAANGDILVSDSGNNRIRLIKKLDGMITTVIGGGVETTITKTNELTELKLNWPSFIRLDGDGGLYIVDTYNYVVRKITFSSTPTEKE